MRRLGVSRRQLFDGMDQPALAVLPAEPFVYAEWRIRRVGLDYHVDVEGHDYSAPHRLLRQRVEARLTARTVEPFHKGERVAVHIHGGLRGRQPVLDRLGYGDSRRLASLRSGATIRLPGLVLVHQRPGPATRRTVRAEWRR